MFKINDGLIAEKFCRLAWEECGPCPVFATYTLTFALQLRKKHGKTSVKVVGKCQLGTIRYVKMAALRVATTVIDSLVSKPIWGTRDVYSRLALRQYISTKLHGVTYRETFICLFATAKRTPNKTNKTTAI